MSEENLEKPQLGDHQIKAVRPVIAIMGSLALPSNVVGRITQHARGETKRRDGLNETLEKSYLYINIFSLFPFC